MSKIVLIGILTASGCYSKHGSDDMFPFPQGVSLASPVEGATALQIAEAERMLDVTFPDEFRQYLQIHNGRDFFVSGGMYIDSRQRSDNKLRSRPVGAPFGLRSIDTHDGVRCELLYYQDVYQFNLHSRPKLIAIAGGTDCGLYCISCASEDYGNVYYWSDLQDWSVDPQEHKAEIEDAIKPIASGFGEFWSKIYVGPPHYGF